MPPIRVSAAVVSIVAAVLLAPGCKKSSSTTSPSDTGTPASPSRSEVFNGVLPVGGSKFYSFSTSVYGTVNATLLTIGGDGVPSTVMVNLGVGTPLGTACNVPAPVRVQAGGSGQVSAPQTPGLYCASISDIGNLFGPASFSVQIDHP